MDSVPKKSNSCTISSQASSSFRSQIFSKTSNDSHTAAEFLNSQLQLEADAREALPYKFDNCTKKLGKLRQNLFSCLTCNPRPENPLDPYKSAGICYSCSIQCHGEHTLVELFNKRDFECDCGTTRLPATSPCTLRINPTTNTKGGAHSEEPLLTNKYNQNFRNIFCGCECDYDPEMQKGTMFQCLGLGTVETGGCGEDWWHPGCVVGLGPDWYENMSHKCLPKNPIPEALLCTTNEITESVLDEHNAEANNTTNTEPVNANDANEDEDENEELPLPPGFPAEDDFEGFICYKCVDAYPWIKRYAGAPGFLPAVFRRSTDPSQNTSFMSKVRETAPQPVNFKKRKYEDDEVGASPEPEKRVKSGTIDNKSGTSDTAVLPSVKTDNLSVRTSSCKLKTLPPAPTGQISLFFKENFRENLCRCSPCFSNLKDHPQLLEAEENYEPSISASDAEAPGSTIGSGSIYDRGESVLKNIDRVRAIEGVMAYNHLKEKLTPFFQQFAESGKAISAEDIKAHFAKMRGDEQAIKEAGEGAKVDSKKEQNGY